MSCPSTGTLTKNLKILPRLFSSVIEPIFQHTPFIHTSTVTLRWLVSCSSYPKASGGDSAINLNGPYPHTPSMNIYHQSHIAAKAKLSLDPAKYL